MDVICSKIKLVLVTLGVLWSLSINWRSHFLIKWAAKGRERLMNLHPCSRMRLLLSIRNDFSHRRLPSFYRCGWYCTGVPVFLMEELTRISATPDASYGIYFWSERLQSLLLSFCFWKIVCFLRLPYTSHLWNSSRFQMAPLKKFPWHGRSMATCRRHSASCSLPSWWAWRPWCADVGTGEEVMRGWLRTSKRWIKYMV